jgi:hypothetical protein
MLVLVFDSHAVPCLRLNNCVFFGSSLFLNIGIVLIKRLIVANATTRSDVVAHGNQEQEQGLQHQYQIFLYLLHRGQVSEPIFEVRQVA